MSQHVTETNKPDPVLPQSTPTKIATVLLLTIVALSTKNMWVTLWKPLYHGSNAVQYLRALAMESMCTNPLRARRLMRDVSESDTEPWDLGCEEFPAPPITDTLEEVWGSLGLMSMNSPK